MALILNSAGFQVFIQCENDQGKELGWNGGPISPGVTRYIQADRIEGNGGSCHCRVYAVEFSDQPEGPSAEPLITSQGNGVKNSDHEGPWPVPPSFGPLITAQDIGPHDLWYFIGGSLTTDSTGLLYTDTSNRLGW